ncbi:aspartate aminotransferase family protein [Erwinia sp. V71]|uniref:aspartate aminotransferase family protein n=1 Tax=Erwinia sp. V71 TaxID=3369424 RepID=UPI003F63FFFE
MSRTLERSEKLTQEFNRYFPGGHSNFRAKMSAGRTKIFVTRCEGSHVWDVDGNEYIVYSGALGPTLLGFRNEKYIKELKNYLDVEAPTYGSSLLYREEDIELAKLLVKHIPCADEVKFCTSGSEAVQLAFRLSRAYTGKSRILRFDGHYHGWFDNVADMCAQPAPDSLSMPFPADTPEEHPMFTLGKSPWAKEESIVVPYNDFAALETVFKQYHGEIAIAHLEAMCSDNFCVHPVTGYLERLRELCDQYNVVLCFDEIVNSFRLNMGGAQAYLGVTPDISTVGKAISGGLPFAAVVGNKKVMDVFREKSVIGAGTYNGYGLGVKACTTAIKMYEENDFALLKHIAALQDTLLDGMVDICSQHHVELLIPEAPGIFYTVFGVKGGRKKVTDVSFLAEADFNFYDRVRFNLMNQGVILGMLGKWFIDGTHTMDDVENTLSAFESALTKTLSDSQ